MSRNELEKTRQTGELAIILAAALSGAAVIISLITAFFIVRSITKPIKQMSLAAYELSNGVIDLNGLSYRSRDEIGQLSHNMRRMANEIRDVIDGMHQMNTDQRQGEWDSRMDESRFKGAYRELAASSNALAESFIQDLLTVTDCMERFSEGNFNVEIEAMPGRKAVINQAVNGFKNNLQGLSKEIMTLTESAHQGNLSARADITEYRGGWADILEQLNTLLYSIIEPVNETSEVISQIAHGHFKMTMQGDYKGDFLLLKENVNGMAKNISGYIYEISHILGEVNNNNLHLAIEREYVGDFAHIKTAINGIIKKFNNVITEIFAAADAVTSGARSISENSMKMADGAQEQASSLETLSSTITMVNQSTSRSAEDADRADTLSTMSRNRADKGDREMDAMLNSMEEIKESSNNISKIIKAIDSIAFQTNLLALNASVEAARAGEHGRGFAVVAGEVRNLATRSQQNAQESANLMTESFNKIADGERMAGETAESLREIVKDVNSVAEIITGIARGAREQAEAISQITGVITEITNVVYQNTANSEEAAAAAQELSSQADTLRGMMEVFKLA